MEKYDNRADYCCDTCEFNVLRHRHFKFRKYMARICGSDPVYGLRRSFLRYTEKYVSYEYVYYNYGKLSDGVYETSVKYYDKKDETFPVCVVKKYMILYGEDYWNFTDKELDRKTILRMVEDIKSRCFQAPA